MFKSMALAAALGAALTTGISFAQNARKSMEPGAHKIHEAMKQSARKMVEKEGPMPADTDRMFAHMMAMHHDDGIRMAQLELKHGNDPQCKALAKKIIAAQTKEKNQLLGLAKRAK